jgi:hypothetical protein
MKLRSVHRWIAISTGVFIVWWIITSVVRLVPEPGLTALVTAISGYAIVVWRQRGVCVVARRAKRRSLTIVMHEAATGRSTYATSPDT